MIVCSYCLSQTELFLRSILDEEPVKTVVAAEAPPSDHLRAASREREKVSQTDLQSHLEAAAVNDLWPCGITPVVCPQFVDSSSFERTRWTSLISVELKEKSLCAHNDVIEGVVVTPPSSIHQRQKAPEPPPATYQDPEDPEYEDFRAEASLQRSRQLESFSKAAEAYKQGRKDVASFYAQQARRRLPRDGS